MTLRVSRFSVFHGFRLVFHGFHGSRSVFHVFSCFFMVPGWFFMFFHGFSWFKVGFSWFFMVFHGFHGFPWFSRIFMDFQGFPVSHKAPSTDEPLRYTRTYRFHAPEHVRHATNSDRVLKQKKSISANKQRNCQ